MKTAPAISICLAFSVPLPAFAQQVEGEESPSIVVTGMRLEDSERALEECLARGCPPEEDIRLSLAHAENQFIEGQYADGQRTLRGSISRTDDAAERLPIPVAGLYRASARIAEHMGEAKDFQLASLDMRDTLREGLGKEHWRTLVADIAVGDSRAKLGKPDDAERIYERTEKHAIELGLPRVAMFARIRQALLLQSRFDVSKQDHWREEMVELLTEIRDRPLPGGEEFALIAQVMLARNDRESGESASTEELIRRFAEQGGVNRPVLISSKPLYSDEDLARESGRADSASARLSTLSIDEPRWADVGFWINAEGQVQDFEILRAQGDTDWLGQVKRQVVSRRYAPLSKERSLEGFYMVERYTLTARFADQTTGTRLRMREPTWRIERLDITPENYGSETG